MEVGVSPLERLRRRPAGHPRLLYADEVYVMKRAAAVLAGVGIGTVECWCASGKLVEARKVGSPTGGGAIKLYRLSDVLLAGDNDWR